MLSIIEKYILPEQHKAINIKMLFRLSVLFIYVKWLVRLLVEKKMRSRVCKLTKMFHCNEYKYSRDLL